MDFTLHEQGLTAQLPKSNMMQVPRKDSFKEQRLRKLDIKHSSTENKLYINLDKSLILFLIYLFVKLIVSERSFSLQ